MRVPLSDVSLQSVASHLVMTRFEAFTQVMRERGIGEGGRGTDGRTDGQTDRQTEQKEEEKRRRKTTTITGVSGMQ